MCQQIRLRQFPPLPAYAPQVFHWNLPGEPTASRQLALTQLRVFLQVIPFGGDSDPSLDAIVSTAEPLSIIPLARWRDGGEFESLITWLEPQHVYQPNVATALPYYPGPPNWMFRDNHPFQLGFVWTIAYDDQGNSLRPSPVIARFLTEPSPDLSYPILGLEHGILTDRLLTRQSAANEPDEPAEWWLRDLP